MKVLRIVFVCLTLAVVGSSGAVDTSSSGVNIQFSCDENGNVKSIRGVNTTLLTVIENEKYCHARDVNDCLTAEHITDKTNVLIMYDQHNSNPNLDEGTSPLYYKLICNQNYVQKVAAVPFSLDTMTSHSVVPKTGTPTPITGLTLSVKGENDQNLPTSISVGDRLTLVLTAGGNSLISPISCTASPVLQEQNKPKDVSIWENCDTADPAILSGQWTKESKDGQPTTQEKIKIDMYAFRFVKSASVKITCTVNVCRTNNCKQDIDTWCDTPEHRRRRREITDKHLSKEVASVQFTVSELKTEFNGSKGIHGIHLTLFVTMMAWWMHFC